MTIGVYSKHMVSEFCWWFARLNDYAGSRLNVIKCVLLSELKDLVAMHIIRLRLDGFRLVMIRVSITLIATGLNVEKKANLVGQADSNTHLPSSFLEGGVVGMPEFLRIEEERKVKLSKST
ncbi:hypothetical protein SASPL_155093 [Salvia splendens]|uniref:Uncharacterized protein n=1 Tax=Salvia splendens TaxID=180675 RepID=A0A8X8YZ14_SALSN|nr:hypothetical protein SASPL_155093 [Salvia splendens]